MATPEYNEKKALHVRLLLTPSGSIHLGHLYMAWLNGKAAAGTNGTIVYQEEDLFVRHQAARNAKAISFGPQNLRELSTLGFPPTSQEELLAKGKCCAPTHVVDDEERLQLYWKVLGLEELVEAWPPHTETPANNWQAIKMGSYASAGQHPFIVLTKVMRDMYMGRNCIIRGDDQVGEEHLYNMIAQLVARQKHKLPGWDTNNKYAPVQWFPPRLRRSGTMLSAADTAALEGQQFMRPLSEGVILSTSVVPHIAGGFEALDIAKAGITPELLDAYFKKILFRTAEDAQLVDGSWTYSPPGTERADDAGLQWGVRHILSKIKQAPIVDDEDWFRFLETGRLQHRDRGR